MKFYYQARTKTGQIKSGTVEAFSKEAAINLLRSYDLYVTGLEEVSPPFYARKIKFLERVSKKEIAAFSRQLSILLKSGVSSVEALETLAKQTKNENLREKILNLAEKIEGGLAFSQAFSLYPKIFSPFYIGLIKSGEATGRFSEVFSYLADYLEREYHFSSKVRGAMIYPLFVLFIFLIVLAAAIFFIIPQLTKVFVEYGQELPTITKAVIDFSNFLRKWGWLLILAFFSLIIFLFYYSRTKEGKVFFDKFWLEIPLIGEFFKKIYLTRFSTNLSTLISGGLPITKALEITSEMVGNEVYKKIILSTSERVKKGESISTALERFPKNITPLFIQMALVGERSGNLDQTLMNVADFYQKEIERSLDNFISLLEPIMIIFLGLLVAGLMVSLLLPIYQRMAF